MSCNVLRYKDGVCAQLCFILCDPMVCSPPGPPVHGISRQVNWSGCQSLLQGVFLTQELNPCLLSLLHWQTDSLPLAPPGKHHKDDTYVNKLVKLAFSLFLYDFLAI